MRDDFGGFMYPNDTWQGDFLFTNSFGTRLDAPMRCMHERADRTNSYVFNHRLDGILTETQREIASFIEGQRDAYGDFYALGISAPLWYRVSEELHCNWEKLETGEEAIFFHGVYLCKQENGQGAHGDTGVTQ